MVQVDLPAAFAIGQVFAALSRRYLQQEPRLFTHRLLGPFNFFMACCYVPVGMFLLIGWPAWEIMYVSDWLDNPYNRPAVAGFYVAFGVVMMVLGNAGFILAHHWYRQGRAAWVRFGIGIGAFLTVLPFLLKWGVWMRVGTYAEVRGGGGYAFWDAPFFDGWLFIMSFMLLSIIGMGWLLRAYARRM